MYGIVTNIIIILLITNYKLEHQNSVIKKIGKQWYRY